jgi:hypothetical protein
MTDLLVLFCKRGAKWPWFLMHYLVLQNLVFTVRSQQVGKQISGSGLPPNLQT